MPDYALIGDIGGTHARFALTDLAAPRPAVSDARTFGDGDVASLAEAARAYLASTDAEPRSAVLAIASPLAGEVVSLTNRAWSFRRADLQAALGLAELRLINDFAAVAWAAPHLAPTDRTALRGSTTAPPTAPVTLIGAGTGLGVGLLTGSAAAGWHVVATEGGHASFAPLDEEDRALAAWLHVRHGRVSNERLLSGDGLACIDACLRGVAPLAVPAAIAGLRRAEDVVAEALSGRDPVSARALERFCRIYGAVAGDAALLHGAHTLLVAGGMVLHFLEFFRASGFLDAFDDKGRYADYMRRIDVHIITHPNPGLLGAAVAARTRAQ